jgi:hypothetical protein
MSWSRIDCALFFIHTIGVLLICVGLFLYEDEEGRFQNKVEEWWIRLSDKQRVSRSAVAAFMQEVARLTGKGFDRLFGRGLLSLRIIPISIFLSFASVFLVIFIMLSHIKHDAAITRYKTFDMFIFFLALALVPAVVRSKWILTLWWTIIPATLLSISGFIIFVFRTRGARSSFYGFGIVALVFVASFVVDLSYIAVTRIILRRIIRIDRIPEILLMLFLNLLALLFPLYGPIYAGVALSKLDILAGGAVMISLMFNSIDLLAGLAAFFLALLLLLHRLFWPAVQRPLYAIYRFAPMKRKKWLVGTGVALLTLTSHTTFGIAKALVKAVLGKL